MMSATLYREGPDLEALLVELDAEHDGRVRVLEVQHVRDGGMLGFFARRAVGVHYVVPAADADAAADADPLEAALAAADAQEAAAAMVTSGRVPEHSVEQRDGDNVEFARMLLEMASEKAAQRRTARDAVRPSGRGAQSPFTLFPSVTIEADIDPGTSAGIGLVVDEQPVARPARRRPRPAQRPRPVRRRDDAPSADVRPVSAPRTSLALRRKLTEIGVPMAWITPLSASPYEVIEHVVQNLPPAPAVRVGPADLLVVAGPAAQAQAEAERLCGRARLETSAIRTAGCGRAPITTRHQAAALGAEIRKQSDGPCIVVVATDSSGDVGQSADFAWAAEIIAALTPDQLYVVIDATCRIPDVSRALAGFGEVTALAMVAVARSSSPASLWQLGVPFSSIDGAPATRGGWAAMLIDRVHDMDGC